MTDPGDIRRRRKELEEWDRQRRLAAPSAVPEPESLLPSLPLEEYQPERSRLEALGRVRTAELGPAASEFFFPPAELGKWGQAKKLFNLAAFPAEVTGSYVTEAFSRFRNPFSEYTPPTFYEQLGKELERPWWQRLPAEVISDPLNLLPVGAAVGLGKRLLRGAPELSSAIRRVPPVSPLPQPLPQAAAVAEPDQLSRLEELEQLMAGVQAKQVSPAGPVQPPPAPLPPLEAPPGPSPSPGGAIQAGFGIGEEPSQGILGLGGQEGISRPLIDPQQVAERQRLAAERTAGQANLPELTYEEQVAVLSPLEQAQVHYDEAVAEMEAGRGAGRGALAPRFGTPERAEYDAARMQAGQAGRRVTTSRHRQQRTAIRLKEARVALELARKDADDLAAEAGVAGGAPPAGTPPPGVPPGEPGDYRKTLAWFKDYLKDPRRIEDWDLTGLQRREARASRFDSFEETLNLSLAEGYSSEEAINRATRVLSGELPTVVSGIKDFVTPVMRQALFDEVSLVLAGEPAELLSTATALRHAILGQAIPRTPGTKGGSAFSRLARVFGEEFTETIAKRQTLNEVLSFQAGKRGVQTTMGPGRVRVPGEIGPPGPFIEYPSTQTFGGAVRERLMPEAEALQPPRAPLVAGKPPGPFGELPADLRSQAERELDRQIYRELLGEAQPPVGPGPGSQIAAGDIPPDRVIKQIGFIPPTTRERMLEWGKTAGLTGIDLANLLRANVASIDLSYLRQQAFLIPGNVTAFAKSFPDALRAIWSKEYAQQIDHAIKSDPVYRFYENGPDFLRALDSKTAKAWEREEQFLVLGGDRPLQKLTDKMPWLHISNRAFVTGINSMNWHIYKGHLRMLMRVNEQIAAGQVKLKPYQSFDIKQSADKFAGMLADMSGRGPLGLLKELSPALNAGFFSVRLNIGRLISPRHLASSDKFTRQAAWKNFTTAIGTYSGLLLAGQQMGLWDLETDPRSSDFMKLRLGRLRVDIWGGYQQYAVLYGRLLGGLKSVKTGEVSAVEPIQASGQFLRSKLSPLFGQILTEWSGKDFKGSDIERGDWKRITRENLPFLVQDVIEAVEAEGLLGLAVGVPAGIIGAGVYGQAPTLKDVSQQLYGLDYVDLPNKTTLDTFRRKRVRNELERQLSPKERELVKKREREIEERAKQREADRAKKFRERRVPVGVP